MTTQTSSLTDFLLARLEEEAANAARLHDALECDLPTVEVYGAAACLCGYRDRALADVEAKRAIVQQCRDLINSFGDWDAEADARAMWTDVNRRERSHAHARLHWLAAVYADHPDYREEWKP